MALNPLVEDPRKPSAWDNPKPYNKFPLLALFKMSILRDRHG